MFGLTLLVAGCTQPAVQQDAIVFDRSGSVTALAEMVDRIELVPLETGVSFLLGVDPMLDLAGDGYVLTDSRTGRVLYFGPDGTFRNGIGKKGRGPGEYAMLLNSQVDAEGHIVVFSYPDKALFFSTDGQLLREEHHEDLGTQSCLVPEGLLSYYGYGSGRPDRLALERPDGSRKGFLPTDAQVINFTPNAPLFTFACDTLYFTDTYNPVVYSYKAGEVREEMRFDFGKSALAPDFFDQEDPYAVMESMLHAPNGFSLVRRYLRDEHYQFVEQVFQKDESMGFYYGVESDGEWRWFSLGKALESPFAGTMQVLSDQCLYFLLGADLLSDHAHSLGGSLASLKALISNPEVMERLTPDDNPVVAKMYLK